MNFITTILLISITLIIIFFVITFVFIYFLYKQIQTIKIDIYFIKANQSLNHLKRNDIIGL